jgi:type IX secretion system PorP/SprF family membrane protein
MTLAKKYFLFLCAISFLEMSGQDIHFSQYTRSPLALNPALTSAYNDLQGSFNHKEQWRSVNAFRTSAVSFEMKFSQFPWVKVDKMTETYRKKLAKGLALGIYVYGDNAGDGNLRHNQANLSLAYHLMLNKENMLSAGLMGGIAQRSISEEELRWNNQYAGGTYNATAGSGETFADHAFTYADYSLGLLWSYGSESRYLSANDQKHLSAGISVYHVTQPRQSFLSENDLQYRRWTAHFNSLFGISNTPYSIGISALYLRQGPQSELTPGFLFKYKPKDESRYTGYVKSAAISVGCLYRVNDALVPVLLLEMDAYSIAVSYDINVSGLTPATSGRGGFEISLRFCKPSPFLYQNSNSIF